MLVRTTLSSGDYIQVTQVKNFQYEEGYSYFYEVPFTMGDEKYSVLLKTDSRESIVCKHDGERYKKLTTQELVEKYVSTVVAESFLSKLTGASTSNLAQENVKNEPQPEPKKVVDEPVKQGGMFDAATAKREETEQPKAAPQNEAEASASAITETAEPKEPKKRGGRPKRVEPPQELTSSEDLELPF